MYNVYRNVHTYNFLLEKGKFCLHSFDMQFHAKNSPHECEIFVKFKSIM